MVPIETTYAVPIEYVSLVVSVLSGAVVYQTRRLSASTSRMERLHDEDRQRAALEDQRHNAQDAAIQALEAENAALRRELGKGKHRRRRPRGATDVDEQSA